MYMLQTAIWGVSRYRGGFGAEHALLDGGWGRHDAGTRERWRRLCFKGSAAAAACARKVFSDRPCFQGVGAVRQDPQQMKRCRENLKAWKHENENEQSYE
jgi:hypothetical protein